MLDIYVRMIYAWRACPPVCSHSFVGPHLGFVHIGHRSMICLEVAPISPASYSFKWFDTRSAIARIKMGLSFKLSALERVMPSWSISPRAQAKYEKKREDIPLRLPL